jgi:hypothetical protein
MSVFARPQDLRYFMLQLTSLAGLQVQTCTEWMLVMVNDDLVQARLLRCSVDNSFVPQNNPMCLSSLSIAL